MRNWGLRSLFSQKGFDKRAGEQALSPLTTMPVLLRKQDFPPQKSFRITVHTAGYDPLVLPEGFSTA